ncbi:MAG TPA: hypothetical protein PKC11_13730 [Agitococcus sp.]|nr:hypothetical protein [Agitococcus sp.]HNC04331.1 hypothetical protein [Agitococcus sp.]
MRSPSPLRVEGRKALERGLKRFVPSDTDYRCKLHGSDTNEHYSSSGRCCLCDTKQKKPEQQAAYWQTVKDEWSKKRKEAYKRKAL